MRSVSFVSFVGDGRQFAEDNVVRARFGARFDESVAILTTEIDDLIAHAKPSRLMCRDHHCRLAREKLPHNAHSNQMSSRSLVNSCQDIVEDVDVSLLVTCACESYSRKLSPTQRYAAIPQQALVAAGELQEVLIKSARVHNVLVPGRMHLRTEEDVVSHGSVL